MKQGMKGMPATLIYPIMLFTHLIPTLVSDSTRWICANTMCQIKSQREETVSEGDILDPIPRALSGGLRGLNGLLLFEPQRSPL